jgi:hypothetical protein
VIIGFDFDGTLVKSWTAEPLAGVREQLAARKAGTRTFIAHHPRPRQYGLCAGETQRRQNRAHSPQPQSL